MNKNCAILDIDGCSSPSYRRCQTYMYNHRLGGAPPFPPLGTTKYYSMLAEANVCEWLSERMPIRSPQKNYQN